MLTNQVAAVVLRTVLLALTGQPLVKVTLGLLLGVRYAYAYLWYVEPRFKIRYSTYIALTPRRRVLLNLTGSIGTPLVLAAGSWQAFEIGSVL